MGIPTTGELIQVRILIPAPRQKLPGMVEDQLLPGYPFTTLSDGGCVYRAQEGYVVTVSPFVVPSSNDAPESGRVGQEK
jgi:hypothetical protein